MAADQSRPERPDLMISIAAECPKEFVSDLLEEAEAAQLSTQFERRDPEVFAVVEWVIPTAIMLFIGRKFIDTFAEQAAKDAYPAVKTALLRVIRRCSGRDRALNSVYVSSSPHKVPLERPVDALTVFVLGPGDVPLRFRFPAQLPEALHGKAVTAIALVAQQYQAPSQKNEDRRRDPVIFTFNSEEEAWKQVDLAAEARAARERSGGVT